MLGSNLVGQFINRFVLEIATYGEEGKMDRKNIKKEDKRKKR